MGKEIQRRASRAREKASENSSAVIASPEKQKQRKTWRTGVMYRGESDVLCGSVIVV